MAATDGEHYFRVIIDGVQSGMVTLTVNDRLTNTEISDALFTSIYPIPTTGTFTLQFEKEGKYIVTLFDLSGKVLLRQTIAGQRVQMDISTFLAGAYVIRIDEIESKRQNVIRIVKD